MSARLRIPVGPEDHAQGPASAPVTLVEYGDLECPHCARAFPMVERVRAAMGDELRFVFRHFPLTEVHPHAQLAAEACEAAAAQRPEAFWDMERACLEHHDTLSIERLIGFALAAGLDAERLRADLRSGVHRDRVLAQFEGGLRSGVNGTPTFFVNEERLDGGLTESGLLATLRHAARQSGAPVT